MRVGMKKPALFLSSILYVGALCSCSSFHYVPYAFGSINETPFAEKTYENYYRQGEYNKLSSADKGEFDPEISTIYSFGSKRHVVPSTGKPYLTVIAVDFEDVDLSSISQNYLAQIEEAFFGESSFNQFVSVAEYYDKSSYHRLQLQGEVAKDVFRSNESYATLKTKNNASQTKSALTRLYASAIEWYNAKNYGRTLSSGDPIYFIYLAPYSGMESGTSSRSSMMWAFTINDPAPICWSSYYMMHPRDNGAVDAHTYIHEFGHMLGLKDYYDQNSYSDLSPCSPLGRMDMMDCSLGEHNAFSKMTLDWMRPYIPTGECEITLRPSSGNDDAILLPLTTYNGTPYDEYLLLEYYTPSYLNYADATLRAEKDMSLMGKAGIKAYHVDGRLGIYDDRGKTPVGVLNGDSTIGNKSVDLYCDNSGSVSAGTATSSKGFLAQLLDASSGSFALCENYIASDHTEDYPIGDKVAHLRDCLFQKGQGIDLETKAQNTHKGECLAYGFKVREITASYAKISVFPLK